VRSSSGEEEIGPLLEQRLPKVAVVDPLVLTAGAVANAIRPRHDLIQLSATEDGASINLVQSQAQPHGSASRLLRRQGNSQDLWLMVRQPRSLSGRQREPIQQRLRRLMAGIRPRWNLWQQERRWLGVPLAMLMITAGIALFSQPVGGWKRGLLITLGLLQGEYIDPVMLLEQAGLMQLLGALAYALVGALITSLLVASILEQLLSDRLGLRRHTRPRNGSRQALVVDGQKVVEPIRALLATERIAVQTASLTEGMGALDRELTRLNNTELVGIGLLSNNLLANVHAALMLQKSGSNCRLAVLAHQVEANDQLGELLGGISVISGVDLAADAFVATAFGERVERVVQIEGLNRLVVRYQLSQGDHLCGLSIARIENGYRMNVLSHRRRGQTGSRAIPPLDWLVQPGDEITVLACLESLRHVECGRPEPPDWQLELRMPVPHSDRFLVQQCLARGFGLTPGQVQAWLDGDWHPSPPLDQDLGEQLCLELQRLRVETRCHP
jgi:Trk K+ transport system NAD-binding subunit